MIKSDELALGIQSVLAAIICSVFLLLLLMDKDEMEQSAFNNALKTSTVVMIISLFGFCLYMLMLGYKNVSIHSIFIGIEGICLLTGLIYFMELKGISFEIRIKNHKLANVLMYISITLGVLATVSLLFEFEFFDNKAGFIRYDEVMLLVNAVLFVLIIPIIPKRKKIDHKEYKKLKKEIDKQFNIMGAIYIVIMVLIISYIAYQKLDICFFSFLS